MLTSTLLAACSLEPADSEPPVAPTQTDDRIVVLCQGLWGLDNSTLSYIDGGTVTNGWFKKNNPGMHLGDTGNDILQVNDTLIAISVNWSNIIQYIPTAGRLPPPKTYQTTAASPPTAADISTAPRMPTTAMWPRLTSGRSR